MYAGRASPFLLVLGLWFVAELPRPYSSPVAWAPIFPFEAGDFQAVLSMPEVEWYRR